MGEIRLVNHTSIMDIVNWLVDNVGPQYDNRNLPLGHRRGKDWYLAVNYAGLTEWYTSDITIDNEEKRLLFLLTFPEL